MVSTTTSLSNETESVNKFSKILKGLEKDIIGLRMADQINNPKIRCEQVVRIIENRSTFIPKTFVSEAEKIIMRARITETQRNQYLKQINSKYIQDVNFDHLILAEEMEKTVDHADSPAWLKRYRLWKRWVNQDLDNRLEKIRWHEIDLFDQQGTSFSHTKQPDSGYFVKCDPYLSALSIALYKAAFLRIWLLLRHVDTEENDGRGWLTRKQIREAIKQLEYEITPDHLRRLLRQGNGTFWARGKNKIFLRKPERVAADLVKLACEKDLADNLVDTELPGNRRPVYVDISGTHEAFEAHLYAAVIAAHGGEWFVSRAFQEKFFNRTAETIRKWEQDRLCGVVEVTPCMAVADLDFSGIIPEHAYKKNGQYHWQIVNHYLSGLRPHRHKGRARKIRHSAESTAFKTRPDKFADVGAYSVKKKRRFPTEEACKRALKRHGDPDERYVLHRVSVNGTPHIFKALCSGIRT